MKIISTLILASSAIASVALAAPKKLWTQEKGLATPESAYYDAVTDRIYVSNIAGQPGEKDGKGWISSLKVDGSVEHERLVEGLDAPKGLGVHAGILWVADLSGAVGIDLKTRKIVHRVPLGAAGSFINDIAIATDGTIYVSDMTKARIYAIKDGKASTLIEGEEHIDLPNGLAVQDDTLWVASWGRDMQPDFATKTAGSLISIDLKTKSSKVALRGLGNLDGLVALGEGRWLISDWKAGKLYSWRTGEPTAKELAQGFQGSADLGLIPNANIVLIPEMQKNALHAYSIDKSPQG